MFRNGIDKPPRRNSTVKIGEPVLPASLPQTRAAPASLRQLRSFHGKGGDRADHTSMNLELDVRRGRVSPLRRLAIPARLIHLASNLRRFIATERRIRKSTPRLHAHLSISGPMIEQQLTAIFHLAKMAPPVEISLISSCFSVFYVDFR